MFSVSSNDHLIRSNLWTSQLKETFEEELMGMTYVNMVTDFMDGETWNKPSLGNPEVYDYAEGQAIRYTGFDTGNFTFSITDYKAAGTYITNKMLQDSYVSSQLMASFVPKQNRALMESIESDILAVGPNGQTASNLNTINGAHHRFVASGSNETMAVKDFARAKYALRKANVPMTNLIAIVDPSVEYHLSTLSTLVSVDNNPRWEGIVRDGMTTGMKFLMNVYGFDVYTSDWLKVNTASETINAVTAAAGVNNLFFSAAGGDSLPFIGSVRQPPRVDSEYNKDLQREEYVTTCRYGFKLYRPENLVVILTDTDQVYA